MTKRYSGRKVKVIYMLYGVLRECGKSMFSGKFKHINENLTIIICPFNQTVDTSSSVKYKLAFVDRKDFEMLLQDRTSLWRAIYKDGKVQIFGSFNGKYDRLARILSNLSTDKNRSVYIANKDELDLRRDNLVVDLRGKHKDVDLNEKLKKIRSSLPKLPYIEVDEEGMPLADKFEPSSEISTGELKKSTRFKISTSITIESPNGKVENFTIQTKEEELLVNNVFNFLMANLD